MNRRHHDAQLPIEYARRYPKEESFYRLNRSLLIPALYAIPYEPERLRVSYEAETGFTQLSEERCTSEAALAARVEDEANADIFLTAAQVRWLHDALGRVVSKLDFQAELAEAQTRRHSDDASEPAAE